MGLPFQPPLLRRPGGSPAVGSPVIGGDDDLVGRAAGGDRRALEELLGAHHARLWAVCRRLLGNDADASDAAQDALIAITRGLAGFDGRSAFTTWTYRIAVNASLDELRRRRRRPVPTEEDTDRGEPTGRGWAPGPDEGLERFDIDAALLRLSPEFRAPVVLRDLCGLDYAEIAEVLDLPPGTVRSRIARGRAALAGMLERPR